jgi:carbon monoxide dehydrogenase subunit G
MRLDQDITIDSPIGAVWGFLMDLEKVSRCVPGVEDLRLIDDDAVAGTLLVRVGPIGLRMEGTVRLTERAAAEGRAALQVEANDRRIGAGVTATTVMQVTGVDERTTALTVRTDAVLLGRLGGFGQPIIRRKADEIARGFAANVAASLGRADGG